MLCRLFRACVVSVGFVLGFGKKYSFELLYLAFAEVGYGDCYGGRAVVDAGDDVVDAGCPVGF